MNLRNLLNKMTIEEKIGQMLQIAPHYFTGQSDTHIAGFEQALGLSEDQIFHTGSVLGINNSKEMIKIQQKYLEKSRLGIPLLFMADIVHGYETIFPIPLAQSCSFNDQIAFKTSRISALEAQTVGIGVTFAPMADLTRDPRWGRVMEGYGEDPYVLSRFVKAAVEGYQQQDLSKEGNIASCMKHFAAYGASEAGRDYNTVDMSKLEFYRNYIQGYRSGIDAGAKMIMTSFNTFDGVPVTVNKHLMVDVLRNELSFTGVTITDYDSLNQVIAHRVAKNQKQAAKMGIDALLDIEMASSCYVNAVKELIEENHIQEHFIDEAVLRILTLKDELGLFEYPYNFASPENEKTYIRTEEHLKDAKETAHECAVLLQNNNNTFPINKQQHILLVGPFVKEHQTNGAWSWKGNIHQNTTLYDALQKKGCHITYVDHYSELSKELFADIDIVICALGEHQNDSGEAKSKTNLHLDYNQYKWVNYAKKLNKKVGVILYNGRPLILTDIIKADAILETWFLGSMANEAIVELLLGEVNPSAKLTMSFPRNIGQIPIYYNAFTTGRPRLDGSNPYTSFYLDCDNSPLFPFGHGLSYSSFQYENMTIDKNIMTENNTITVTVDITNRSAIDGYEIVQLYIKDEFSLIARPELELINYQKVWIKKHTTKQVVFTVSYDELMYYDSSGNKQVESGNFQIMVGPSSNKLLTKKIVLEKENDYDY